MTRKDSSGVACSPEKGVDSKRVEAVIAWLKKRDLSLWIEGETAKRARLMCAAELKLKITAKVFRQCVADACEWFRKVERRRLSDSRLLNREEWERLAATVAEMLPKLQGHTRRECAFMVSSQCRCNEMLLQGLTSQYHVWSDAKKRYPDAPWYAY